jgi:acyl-[acyl-carrier protein] desaturase
METRLAMRMYQEYTDFFKKAELERRWNVFEDIPWDKINKNAGDDLALCAETFCGVEMYLPDYLRSHLDLMRGDYGRAWFAANWGYEEAKHSLALREYLRRSGARDDDELHDYAETVLARSWRAPYDDGRRMTIYGALQELQPSTGIC